MGEVQLTSGELLYRKNLMGYRGSNLYKEVISNDFWMFLDADDKQTEGNREITYKDISISNRKLYKDKIFNDIELTLRNIRLLRMKATYDLSISKDTLLESLRKHQKKADATFLSIVIAYYAILDKEMDYAKNKLFKERSIKAIQLQQAKIARDVKIFSLHLSSESKGGISLLHIESASPQFERCEKAVFDNIDPLSRTRQSHLKVLNVFKLQNSILSKQLQVRKQNTNI
jgi:hypothetical protein